MVRHIVKGIILLSLPFLIVPRESRSEVIAKYCIVAGGLPEGVFYIAPNRKGVLICQLIARASSYQGLSAPKWVLGCLVNDPPKFMFLRPYYPITNDMEFLAREPFRWTTDGGGTVPADAVAAAQECATNF
jgi:hypothetical protein